MINIKQSFLNYITQENLSESKHKRASVAQICLLGYPSPTRNPLGHEDFPPIFSK